jgi:hypothetical protein
MVVGLFSLFLAVISAAFRMILGRFNLGDMGRDNAVANVRLSNRVIAALEDATAVTRSLWPAVSRASRQAERLQDVVMLASLVEITAGLATIERKTRGARNGEYID